MEGNKPIPLKNTQPADWAQIPGYYSGIQEGMRRLSPLYSLAVNIGSGGEGGMWYLVLGGAFFPPIISLSSSLSHLSLSLSSLSLLCPLSSPTLFCSLRPENVPSPSLPRLVSSPSPSLFPLSLLRDQN